MMEYLIVAVVVGAAAVVVALQVRRWVSARPGCGSGAACRAGKRSGPARSGRRQKMVQLQVSAEPKGDRE